MTRALRFAVVGDPIAHSKSPAMHAAAYRALGMPHTYEAIRVVGGEAELAGVVGRLRDGVLEGINVTVPHKQRVLELVDRVDPTAAAVGAANTLVRAGDGRIVAHNTDVGGLAAELRRLAPGRTESEWRASRAVVLGSGGAARAAIAALARSLGVAGVRVWARRGPPSPALPPDFGGKGGEIVWCSPSPPNGGEGVGGWGASVLTVVQATSAGMTGADPGDSVAAAIAWSDLPDDAVALDVVYSPPETPFLRAARSRGLRCANGLGMLVEQGALAFELWLGVPAPRDAMLAAVR